MVNLPDNSVSFSWDRFHRDTLLLARLLETKGAWNAIVAISRGGLIPAAIVARKLGIRLIDTICITSYTNNKKCAPSIIKNISIADENFLLIDDIADTGDTVKIIRNRFPTAHYATVYAKPAGKPFVDSFIHEIGQGQWVVFPWEHKE